MNYMLAVMEAVSYSVATGSNQQLADGNTTTIDTQIEEGVYTDWQQRVSDAATAVTTAAANLAKDPNNKTLQANLTAAQASFQNTETEQQTYTQQADAGTQAMQNQTGQDSSTMQQKVQLEAAVNQVAQSLASILGQNY